MRLLASGVGCLLLVGCGLTLDYFPPEDASVGFDASSRSDSGSADDCDQDAECDDGDACNGVETCVEGRCAPGAPLDCADALDCTVDTCDAQLGCARAPDDARCEDDGFACTIERCDPDVGCERELNDGACDDGVFCTVDRCDAAAGCRHDPVDARCGAGTCDPATGCVGTECVEPSDCFRGPCDLEVACESGRCVRTPRADGTSCADDNPCTRSTTCVAGECRGVESSLCPGQPCLRCNATGGGCDGSILASTGTACDDGDLCTLGDACDHTGTCTSSSLRACTAVGPCRTNVCNPSTGLCEAGAVTGACDDGNPCTAGDSCSSGVCAGSPVSCAPDGNPCTSDACQMGAPGGPPPGCSYPPLPAGTACDDGDPCTVSSSCGEGGVCRPMTLLCPPDPDPDICTTVVCTSAGGGCATNTLLDGTTCALNARCLAGNCQCRPGFEDCDGDDACECDLETHFCEAAMTGGGARTCQPYRTCPTCIGTQTCCPCTGACYDLGCDGCCMFCPRGG